MRARTMIEGLPAELAAKITPAALEAMTPEDRADAIAALEAIRAARARDSLIEYARMVMPSYQVAQVHRQIASILERLADPDDPLDRAMVNVRPRIGKSTLASEIFPGWYLGKYPDKQLIAASWGDDLASKFGRRVRNVMEGAAHGLVFPEAKIAPDTRSAGHWETTAGGVYVAQGIEGGIIGFGADGLILDDVVRGYQDATSETKQERLWEWWQSDAQSRLHPGAWVLIINTRWTDNDLPSRLLADMEAGGDQWEVFDLPAIDANGVPLWPERFTPENVERTRRNILPHIWQAAYMCNPTPAEGNMLRRENLRYWQSLTRPAMYGAGVEKIPMRIYSASDWALGTVKGDYTVHSVFGVDPEDQIYLLDCWRRRADTLAGVEALCDLFERWRPLWHFEEKAQIEGSVGPFLTKRMKERRIYVSRYRVSSARDKVAKAQSFAGRFNMGMFLIPDPKRVPWAGDVEAELLRFPASRNDDFVDTASIFCRALPNLIAGRNPAPPPGLSKGVIVSFHGESVGPVRPTTWDEFHREAGVA